MKRVSEWTSKRSGGRERSEQSGASKRVSGASERANRRTSGSVLTSVFFSIFDHSGGATMRELGSILQIQFNPVIEYSKGLVKIMLYTNVLSIAHI